MPHILTTDRVRALVSSEVDSMADVSESGEVSAGRAATVSDGEVEAVVADDVSSPAEF
jgi:hypothetical protein